jgi:hypothetical protein
MIMLDINAGAPLRSIAVDPAVDSQHPRERDAALDMFDPRNGFDPKTQAATYSPQFARKYLAAQGVRDNKLSRRGWQPHPATLQARIWRYIQAGVRLPRSLAEKTRTALSGHGGWRRSTPGATGASPTPGQSCPGWLSPRSTPCRGPVQGRVPRGPAPWPRLPSDPWGSGPDHGRG